MKIAYLIPCLKIGGWRNHAEGFISAISQYVEPVVIVASRDSENAKTLFSAYPLITLPSIQSASLRLSQLSQITACLRAIYTQRYPCVDLVHSLEAYPAGLVGHWLATRLKRPHVLTAHGTYSLMPCKRFLNRLAFRHVLRKAEALCPVSPGTASLIEKSFPDAVARTLIHPILNGNDFCKSVPRNDAVLRPVTEVPTVLSVGAVKPRKGYHLSLRAFARVKEMVPSARYRIVGKFKNRNYYHELLQFIAAHRIKDVEFLGSVSDDKLKQCYREASVFILAAQHMGYHFEGFGLVYIEAGAFGLPVIGTRIGGVPDAIREGETGFLVEPEDVEAMARSLHRLLTDRALARKMGLANRDWAETLTWERCAREQLRVYEQVLQ